MATDKITYTNKRSGDLWTSRDANEVKEVVNGHADAIDNLTSRVSDGESSFDNAVLVVPQTLTSAKKNQARSNIEAAGIVELEEVSDELEELKEASGIIYFNGFVSGVAVQAIGLAAATSLSFFYDTTRKQFLCKPLGSQYYYTDWSVEGLPGMSDFENHPYGGTVTPWPSRVYKNRADGKPYMWDGTDLVCLINGVKVIDPLQGMSFISGYTPSISLQPNVMNRVTSRLIGGLNITSFVDGPSGEVAEYRLEFRANGSDFTLTLPEGIRWVDGEEPEWEDGYTYQVSIEDGLAVGAGWPN